MQQHFASDAAEGDADDMRSAAPDLPGGFLVFRRVVSLIKRAVSVFRRAAVPSGDSVDPHIGELRDSADEALL